MKPKFSCERFVSWRLGLRCQRFLTCCLTLVSMMQSTPSHPATLLAWGRMEAETGDLPRGRELFREALRCGGHKLIVLQVSNFSLPSVVCPPVLP